LQISPIVSQNEHSDPAASSVGWGDALAWTAATGGKPPV